ncbi:thiamine permease [Arthrobacter sp. MYb211]|uniref:purine-cytosine permease family protein n=1 Tax=Micrococcaceae TaxID=1268 RepID=UPI000BB7F09B|nr:MULTISPECIES: cytosine permease [Micrococcaceae]PCC36845.1 thiamine permease [Glutamicibacter sp. BW77]PRA00139.1 thiamine permease [Arthrobacter sp. MYb224]PRA04312.1 thiamine permease [Arthrobacter sp. MYb229]PRA10278.1 thiamine permease [Arthrobacter sp. MYb221]PRB51776.1 thiamine permease [Arthrobacter sp. MYb216]
MDYAIEAERGRAPLPPSKRLWGFWEYTWANAALAIATWGFLIGGSLALVVDVKQGLSAIVLGNVLGVLLVGLAVSVSAGKYGTEQYTFMRSVFGHHGSRLIYIVAMILLTVGWLVVLGIMFGRSIDSAVSVVLQREPEPTGWHIYAITLVAIAITAFVVAKGPTSIKVFNTIVAPALFLVMGVMIYIFLKDSSLAELLSLPALSQPFDSNAVNFMIAVEINIAAGFSWWPYLGNLSRITKNERVAFWPNLIGIGAAASLGEAVGLVGAIKFGSADPTQWMTESGGLWLSVIVLLFVAFANVTSMANILYTAVVGLRQMFDTLLRRFSWEQLVAGFCLVPAVVLFVLPGLYDGFMVFLVWTAALYSALTGIMIVDYFILRRTHVALKDLFIEGKASRYYFTGGFNIAAMSAFAIGAAVFTVTFNPYSFEHSEWFRYTTASLLAAAAAGSVYWIASRLFILPRGLGAYTSDSTTSTTTK